MAVLHSYVDQQLFLTEVVLCQDNLFHQNQYVNFAIQNKTGLGSDNQTSYCLDKISMENIRKLLKIERSVEKKD